MAPLWHYRCICSRVYFWADDDGELQNTAKSDSYRTLKIKIKETIWLKM
jgi:hypothetical protein